MLKPITFISEWDNECLIESPAELDTTTGEIVNMGENNADDNTLNDINQLTNQYVVFENGVEKNVIEMNTKHPSGSGYGLNLFDIPKNI